MGCRRNPSTTTSPVVSSARSKGAGGASYSIRLGLSLLSSPITLPSRSCPRLQRKKARLCVPTRIAAHSLCRRCSTVRGASVRTDPHSDCAILLGTYIYNSITRGTPARRLERVSSKPSADPILARPLNIIKQSKYRGAPPIVRGGALTHPGPGIGPISCSHSTSTAFAVSRSPPALLL